jgi:hypothetical protein
MEPSGRSRAGGAVMLPSEGDEGSSCWTPG